MQRRWMGYLLVSSRHIHRTSHTPLSTYHSMSLICCPLVCVARSTRPILTVPRFPDHILSSWQLTGVKEQRPVSIVHSCCKIGHTQGLKVTIQCPVSACNPIWYTDTYQFSKFTGNLQSLCWFSGECHEAPIHRCLE